ncbi:MAG: hypothetical protein ACI9SC_003209, partial [Gammaproteobacteria bacterium]
AHVYNITLSEGLSPEDQKTLRRCLVQLANLPNISKLTL